MTSRRIIRWYLWLTKASKLSSFRESESVKQFVNILTFPALDKLAFTYDDDEDKWLTHDVIYWPPTTMNAFIERSACNLTVLIIQTVSISDTDLLSFLYATPLLQVLHVHEPNPGNLDKDSKAILSFPITAVFLQNMTAYMAIFTRQKLLPMLEELSLTIHHRKFYQDDFVCMVTSRYHSLGFEYLSTVKLTLGSKDDPWTGEEESIDIDDLARSLDDGFDLRWFKW
ncbi:hypothetical protein D9757_007290 [Collybiopsis confluens]|uniref:Uncharacterized protein n=1 Tax=Collybiopsis confluens TaxID=2823264 RepID=A0A8H5HGN1_9AGAR|nr:hypothetical protein D9757_007290 [Collybiopsis confluens]